MRHFKSVLAKCQHGVYVPLLTVVDSIKKTLLYVYCFFDLFVLMVPK